MSYHYSNTERQTDRYACPDVEVFYAETGTLLDEEEENYPEGWYYWFCFPGCLPDSTPFGPFKTEEQALKAAQEGEQL